MRFEMIGRALASYSLLTAVGLFAKHAHAQQPWDAGAPFQTPGVVDVTVRTNSVEKRMEQSAESVLVTDLTESRRQSADLGELLARTGGIGIRRAGGLGSDTRVQLAGFEGDQVRVLIDGLPIEFTGFGMGLSNVPVSLLQRVEIYRGTVPVRFGANALGGAINIVTRQPTRSGGYSSLQLGSFGTVRAAAGANYLHEPSGLVARANAFYDAAKNDYPVRVAVGNPAGGTSYQDVYRKHDAYRAGGGGLDVGFVRKPWAERLMLRTFASGRSNQFQSDLAMAIPYGAVHYGGENYGMNLEYAHTLWDRLKIEALAGYGMQKFRFVDVSPYLYDWFGQRLRMEKPGELGADPINQRITEHGTFARVQAAWELDRHQTLRLVIAPSYTTRTGKDREIMAPDLDPLAADRRLLTFINALEHNSELFSDRLENTLFGKSYLYRVSAEEPLQNDNWRSLDRNDHRFGVGDGLSVHATSYLLFKAAYELATRLPRAEEVFGDGGRVSANLNLKPEHSHNTNLSVVLHDLKSPAGMFGLEAHLFDRRASQLITLLGSRDFATYRNISNAHAKGVEALGSWKSPGNYLQLDGNANYITMRNDSKTGEYASFKGDRIPNRPYLFSNGNARLSLPRVISEKDEVVFGYNLRYVHWFWRAWESGGTAGPKQRIPSQLSHALSLTYLIKLRQKSYSWSMEVQNLGDARIYDNFGTQRPGRAFYSKINAEF